MKYPESTTVKNGRKKGISLKQAIKEQVEKNGYKLENGYFKNRRKYEKMYNG